MMYKERMTNKCKEQRKDECKGKKRGGNERVEKRNDGIDKEKKWQKE